VFKSQKAASIHMAQRIADLININQQKSEKPFRIGYWRYASKGLRRIDALT
jgi:hypothetical protein